MSDLLNSPGDNPARRLARKLQENKSSIHIGRVPDKVRESFIDLANEEFCSDYGMTLKFLLDRASDYNMIMMFEKIQNHEERIKALELKPEPKPERKKMLNGKTI